MLRAQKLSFLCGPLKSASVHAWELKHSHQELCVPKWATSTECRYHQSWRAVGAGWIIPLDFAGIKAFQSWFAHCRKQSESHSSQTLLCEFTDWVHGREIQVFSLKGFFHAQCSWTVSPTVAQPPHHQDNGIVQIHFQEWFGLQIVDDLWDIIWNLPFVTIEANRRRCRSVNTTSSVLR